MAAPPADYRELAHQILTEDRFRAPPLPRPLHGLLDALGGALAPIGRLVSRAFDAVAGILPGGSATESVLLGAVVVAAAVAATARLTGRTLSDRVASDRGRPGRPEAIDAATLEAAADAAERDGHYDQAVRLRFRAGLLRLDELGLVAYRPSLATAAVSRRLGSPAFDALARRFEEIAYGGQPAGPADAGQAREVWPRVLAAAGPGKGSPRVLAASGAREGSPPTAARTARR
jgi:hypothetical protein